MWLLAHASKVLSILINERLQDLLEQVLDEFQVGYRRGHGTTDATFTLRQIIEQIRGTLAEKGAEHGVYLLFVDLAKAFDKVPRKVLWRILEEKLSVPENMVRLIQAFHDGMAVHVLFGGVLGPGFGTESGVRQGCVKAPTLWDLYFFFVLQDWRGRCSALWGSDWGVALHVPHRWTCSGPVGKQRGRLARRCG